MSKGIYEQILEHVAAEAILELIPNNLSAGLTRMRELGVPWEAIEELGPSLIQISRQMNWSGASKRCPSSRRWKGRASEQMGLSGPLPEHLLRCMAPKDRRGLGKAGLTAKEAIAVAQKRLEREEQRIFAS